MKLNIVFRNLKNEDLFGGKQFDFHITNFPPLNEYVMFDYIEENESYLELYEALARFKTDYFLVTKAFHYSAVSKEHNTAGLIFVTGEVRE